MNISDFTIDNEILEKHKDLILLIIESITIETKEQKQYWIDSISTMNDEQIADLYNILDEEKKELDDIEKEYQEKISKADQKAIDAVKREELELQKKARILAEKQDQESEDKIEEDLLKQLDDITQS